MRKFNKIFGVGLNRTGTSSLHEALRILDIKSYHRSTDLWEKMEINRLVGKRLLEGLEKFQAFLDHPIDWHYEQLDIEYPGSLFIYTYREMESWIESRMWLAKSLNTKVTREMLVAQWLERDKDVRKYFKDRENVFLEINICAGEGWNKLCPFLEVESKVEFFPHMAARKII